MKITTLLFLLLSCTTSIGADEIVQANTVVPAAYRNVGEYYGVPYKVLFAVGMQESQRRLNSRKVMPWPWTLNINGEGKFYDTSTEMREALFSALDRGISNIDVGLMQINIKWHLAKSYSLIDLMRPEDNLNIAAQILVFEHRRCGSSDDDWHCAIGGYHSYHEGKARAYAKRVMRWHATLQ